MGGVLTLPKDALIILKEGLQVAEGELVNISALYEMLCGFILALLNTPTLLIKYETTYPDALSELLLNLLARLHPDVEGDELVHHRLILYVYHSVANHVGVTALLDISLIHLFINN